MRKTVHRKPNGTAGLDRGELRYFSITAEGFAGSSEEISPRLYGGEQRRDKKSVSRQFEIYSLDLFLDSSASTAYWNMG